MSPYPDGSYGDFYYAKLVYSARDNCFYSFQAVNYILEKITSDGNWTTVAGAFTGGYAVAITNNSLLTAILVRISAMAVAPDGNLFFAAYNTRYLGKMDWTAGGICASFIFS